MNITVISIAKITLSKNVGMWGCGGRKYNIYIKNKKVCEFIYFIFLIENGGFRPHIPTNPKNRCGTTDFLWGCHPHTPPQPPHLGGNEKYETTRKAF